MSDTSLIDKTISFIQDIHKKNADGCKGSCFEQTVGFSHGMYEDDFWFCTFGGYCLGDLSRHTVIKAPTLEELHAEVVKTITEALDRQFQLVKENE